MKKITREIRNEIKILIENVGGIDNILNQHKNELKNKYMEIYEIKEHSNEWTELITTIDNQIDYFRYRKEI